MQMFGAVVRRFGASAACDVHAAAGAVLDDDRLAETLLQSSPSARTKMSLVPPALLAV